MFHNCKEFLSSWSKICHVMFTSLFSYSHSLGLNNMILGSYTCILTEIKKKLLVIYSHTVCKMGKNKSVLLLNLYLRDCCTKYRCNGNQKTSWNLRRPACNRTSVLAHSVQNKKFPVSNEMQSLKDNLELDVNERHLTVTAKKKFKAYKICLKRK